MTGMTHERLRQTIARTTIPLLGEYETLTMARIARAAGIGEADLLAVFADKEAVIQACVSMLAARNGAVMDPAEESTQAGRDPCRSASRVAPLRGDRHPRRLLPSRPH